MWQGTPTLGARLAAAAGSIAIHAAVATTALGHASSGTARSSSSPAELAMVEIEAPALEMSTPAPPVTVPAPTEHAHTHATHTHPYPVPADHDDVPHDPSLVHVPLHVPGGESAHAEEPDAPASVAAADAPTFVLHVGGARVTRDVAGSGAPSALASATTESDETFAEATVDTPAHLVAGASPSYPSAAARAGIETDVPLEIVIDARGAVVDARVLRPAGYGLDEAALRGVRAYRFAPAMRRGRPARVRMRWSVEFRLR
jgi:protein TonB